MKRTKNFLPAFVIATLTVGSAQTTELAPVVSKPISRTIELPGEFQPFQSVSIHAKVRGYVDRVLVDRGSAVKQGQLLAELTAPEMKAQIVEAESKVQAAESDRLQAEAQLAAAQSTYDRLKKAAETPGAIAGNELVQAQKQVEAAQALVQSKRQAGIAVEATVRAQKDLEAYLRITAPFDGSRQPGVSAWRQIYLGARCHLGGFGVAGPGVLNHRERTADARHQEFSRFRATSQR
jgi:membrane fusion protein (multidrug efflux system)